MIYGVSNRAGGGFAHFLAQKGFNLILIERDMQPLNDLENNLQYMFGQAKIKLPVIHKIVLTKFDQETLADKFKDVLDLPVKLIVNCKNSKKKNVKKQQQPREENKGQRDDDYDQYAAAESLLSKEEIYFTGKENMEGYACLVNIFIRQLSVPFDHVGIINVDNWDPSVDRKNGGVKHGNLFFQSTVSFQDTFTTMLGR